MYFLVNKKTIANGVPCRISSFLAINFSFWATDFNNNVKIKIELNPVILSRSQMSPSAGEFNKKVIYLTIGWQHRFKNVH